ncbi:MAG: hypothetical protein PHE27_04710 [Alphaproteobacteria bacterium]|nr:hypothetical protein [Alphaproteobacteria bacterium]
MKKKLRIVVAFLALSGLVSVYPTAARADLVSLEAMVGAIFIVLTQMYERIAYIAGDIGDISDDVSSIATTVVSGGGGGGGGSSASVYEELLRHILHAITGSVSDEINTSGYNTNYILAGPRGSDVQPASASFNILALTGGYRPAFREVSNSQLGNAANTEPYSDIYGLDGFIGEDSPYFDIYAYNTNSLLQNSLLGPSGTGLRNLTTVSTGSTMGAVLSMPLTSSGGVSSANNALVDLEGAASRSTLVGQLRTGHKPDTSYVSSLMSSISTIIGSSSFQSTPTIRNDPSRAFDFKCNVGFQPAWSDEYDDESKIVRVANSECSKGREKNFRKDRSLEALLGPLQYAAPPDMADPKDPTSTTPLYTPFGFGDGGAYDDFIPIVAAANFCMNIAYTAYPKVPAVNDQTRLQTLFQLAYRESIDGRVVANCWRFFEERVQYGSSSSGSATTAAASFSARHDQQVARCLDDYNKHIISEAAYTDCRENGRSTLKARADVAYRMNSPTYIHYLNTLGVATRELILAQAMGEPERFEQNLLLERQIMTQALGVIDRRPLGKDTDKSSLNVVDGD